MSLCINNSGTYRNITTLCVNQSGTYRKIGNSSINQAGTYRQFILNLGASYEGGLLICKQAPNLRWVAAPISAEVSRSWYDKEDAITRAQQVSGVGGWFIPCAARLQNPGMVCQSFWCPGTGRYWALEEANADCGIAVGTSGNTSSHRRKGDGLGSRAFRCVSY